MVEKKDLLISLIAHYTRGNKAKFASKLGVTPQTINTWISRNTFDADRIFANCENLSAEWLLTGQGSMLKQPADSGNITSVNNKGIVGSYNNIGGSVTQVSSPDAHYGTTSGSITVHNTGNNKQYDENMKDWRALYISKENQVIELKKELCEKLAGFTADLKEKDAYIKDITREAYRRNSAKDEQINKMFDEIIKLREQIEKLTNHILASNQSML
ncbi:MAG: helix-turn-helix domain containing protein [Tannerella sp.]|jgi:hypothetical protein|nr:helix-turn-helix domain containing protein [Tannerella sp.]